jgi:hypothetical protein
MYGEVIAAVAAGEWRLTEYDGAGFSGKIQHRYAGIVAVRGDIRIQVEWQCPAVARRPAGPWQHRGSAIAVRHGGHDPADFARVHPARWLAPATRDTHRRQPVSCVWSVVRLLGRDDDTLAAVILTLPLARPRRRRRLRADDLT